MQKCNKCDYIFGGLSGPSVKPYSLDLIRYIKSKYKDTVVIGGGGIRSIKDVKDYKEVYKFLLTPKNYRNKIGQIDSEISGLIKRKKNNGKEEPNHSSILKKSISRSLNKKKSILLEQELQKDIENSFAAKKKSLNQKNYIYDK